MKKLVDERFANELTELCNILKNQEIYIYGHGKIALCLAKWFESGNYKIKGFIVSKKKDDELNDSRIFLLDEIDKSNDFRIIIGVDDVYYHEIVPYLIKEKVAFEHVFFTSQRLKDTVVNRMTPLKKTDFHYSVHLAEHCNLKCQMCNEFSSVAEPEIMSLDTYEKDCKRLSELFDGNMKWINITGGEAMLNPDITKFCIVTRRYFPHSQIKLCTNGLLLKNADDEFWKELKEDNIELWVTPYPVIDCNGIQELASKHGVKLFFALDFFSDDISIKTSTRFPMDVNGEQQLLNCVYCGSYQSWATLYKGKIYPCAQIYPSKHLNKKFGTNFVIEREDSIDIHKVDSWEEITEFITEIPHFCRYCKVFDRIDGYKWNQSAGKREEWID